MVSLSDVLGWVAVFFTLAAFSMRTMQPLRLAAIGANLFFIAYAHLEGMLPILALHAVLLPFNVIRLRQISLAERPVKRQAQRPLRTLHRFMARPMPAIGSPK